MGGGIWCDRPLTYRDIRTYVCMHSRLTLGTLYVVFNHHEIRMYVSSFMAFNWFSMPPLHYFSQSTLTCTYIRMYVPCNRRHHCYQEQSKQTTQLQCLICTHYIPYIQNIITGTYVRTYLHTHTHTPVACMYTLAVTRIYSRHFGCFSSITAEAILLCRLLRNVCLHNIIHCRTAQGLHPFTASIARDSYERAFVYRTHLETGDTHVHTHTHTYARAGDKGIGRRTHKHAHIHTYIQTAYFHAPSLERQSHRRTVFA